MKKLSMFQVFDFNGWCAGKEELERVVKNLSVLARQSCIHLMIVVQSAGTENINSTTRSNLTKILYSVFMVFDRHI
ncbi:hypothetical protein [Ruminococcus sp. NK3A76]|uniref:hypothetical protein n=1 Tax=Ruminococcus sp. NK3A76 TaxID=877411 RepID=UPI00048D37DA|nr:hypothetical protein [Ruminococcus sp. NK3A76]